MKIDLTVQENVVALMQSSSTEDQWNNNVDKVKDANNGYPSFWYSAIILSGVMRKTAAGFGLDDNIHVWAK